MRSRPRKALRNRLEPCVHRAAQRQVRLYTCTHTTPRQHDNGGRTFAEINDERVRTWGHVDPLARQILDLQAGMIRRLQQLHTSTRSQ